MKRYISLLLAVLLVVMIAGCGGKKDAASAEQNNTVQDNGTIVDEAPEVEADNSASFSGDVTEEVVRNYRVTPESEFEYDIEADGVRITGYNGKDTIVVIPETIGGETVVDIALSAFANDSPVRGVYIPKGVKSLWSAFGNNDDLEVIIWESAQVIGDNTFNCCTSLHTVVLGDELTFIGENAFAICAALKELYVAASVEEIDPEYAPTVFFWCDELTIKGEAGSYIESFCAEQGIPFEAV